MKVTLIPSDGVALVNGRAIHIDLSDFPSTIHAVQWDGLAGHIEYNDGSGNHTIDSFAAFQPWLDRWEAARAAQDAPPPPPTPEQIKIETVREINRIKNERLNGGFVYNSVTYPCDAIFQQQLTAFIVAWESGILPPEQAVIIRTYDDKLVPLTWPAVKMLAAAVLVYVQTVYAESWAAKDVLV